MSHNTLSLAHDFLRRTVQPGAHCIDATAGRGRDTALLARLAGKDGQVWAFDIQPEAVEQTRALLAREGLQATVFLDSHENLSRCASPGTIDCIVFNFGRLPGGDPAICTTENTSIAAIDAGLTLLRPGGIMSLSLYYGGANGYGERDAILAHLKKLDPKRFSVLVGEWCNRPNDPPIPIFLWKDV